MRLPYLFIAETAPAAGLQELQQQKQFTKNFFIYPRFVPILPHLAALSSPYIR